MNLQTLTENVIKIHKSLHSSAVKAINRLLTMRNWLIGYYIVEYEQNGDDKAKYGDKVLYRLAEELKLNSLSNSNERELRRYRSFYQTYPQIGEIIGDFISADIKRGTLSPELISLPIRESLSPEFQKNIPRTPPEKLFNRLSFSHFIELMTLSDPLKRTFYELECIKGNWSVRELKRQINSLYFERSGLSKKPEKLSEIIQNKIEPIEPRDIIKNIYAFEFLGLPIKDVVEETDFEKALLQHLQEFLIELGHGFCFEARQKRILIGDEYYFIDLVFYHRILKCHILVDLKVEEFKHSNAGQLNTYLNYYKDVIVQPSDNPPVGILLVTDKNKALAQYATAGMNENLFVQKYLLELPSKQQLENYIVNELPNLK